MATLEALKAKVLTYIGETEAHDDGAAVRYDIDTFLVDAMDELALTAPLSLLPVVDFSSQTINEQSDGSGVISLPDDFMRLAEFKMAGWSRVVTAPITELSTEFNRQHNPITRGGVERPVVIISTDGDGKMRLRYFSVPANSTHTIERATYVVKLSVEKLPQRMVSALCWLTAANILAVIGEGEAATMAHQRYEQQIMLNYGNAVNNGK